MKRCPECSRGYGDELFYCLNDGSYLSPVREPEPTISAPAPTLASYQVPDSFNSSPTKNKKTSKVMGTFGFVVLGLSVGALAVIIAAVFESRPSDPAPSYNFPVPSSSQVKTVPTPSPLPTLTPSPIIKSERIIDEVFEIREAWHKAVPVNVPSNAINPRVAGAFTASDVGINFLIMPKPDYDQLSDDVIHLMTAPAFYKVSEKRSFKVNQFITSGSYYLIFDNDVPHGKGFQTVAAEFYLKYEQP